MILDTVFWIQVGQPKILVGHQEPAQDLSAALQAIFPMETEDLSIAWNQAFIKVSYKYDLGVLIDSLLPFLTNLATEPSGAELVSLGSNTFHADWDVSWDADRVSIHASWYSVVGDIDWVRDRCRRLEMSRIDFLAEWKMPLFVLRSSITDSGITLADASDLPNLDRILSRISTWGRLY